MNSPKKHQKPIIATLMKPLPYDFRALAKDHRRAHAAATPRTLDVAVPMHQGARHSQNSKAQLEQQDNKNHLEASVPIHARFEQDSTARRRCLQAACKRAACFPICDMRLPENKTRFRAIPKTCRSSFTQQFQWHWVAKHQRIRTETSFYSPLPLISSTRPGSPALSLAAPPAPPCSRPSPLLRSTPPDSTLLFSTLPYFTFRNMPTGLKTSWVMLMSIYDTSSDKYRRRLR